MSALTSLSSGTAALLAVRDVVTANGIEKEDLAGLGVSQSCTSFRYQRAR